VKKILYLIICFNLVACATMLPEKEAYDQIINFKNSDRYSKANLEIFKFEAAYPESTYLCELWTFQKKYYAERNTNEGYIKKIEEKENQKCKK
jgi:hypothetical protein